MKNPECNCSARFSLGDSTRRLWKCEKCGKRGFHGTMLIIKEISEKLKITQDEAWDLANDFLNSKYEEAKSLGKIYYCEYYFNTDLKNKFL